MNTVRELGPLLGLWLAVAAIVAVVRWRNRAHGVGLVLTYLVMLAMNHWLATLLYLLPWYWGIYDSSLVGFGFRQSLYGVVGFAVGALVLWPIIRRSGPWRDWGDRPAIPARSDVDPRYALLLMLIGLVSYFIVMPRVAQVPTLSALVGALPNLLLVGLALNCWQAWQDRKPGVLAAWLVVAAVWPLITVGTSGFLGAGLAFFVTLLAFVFQFLGFRLRLLLVSLVFFYLGLSVYVTYMQSRSEIRSVVWNDETGVGERADAIIAGARGFEWFDPFNEDHLYWLDIRMSQNFLVGSANSQLEAGYVEYARGKTLLDVLIMLVPRAVWPDKPLMVGGSDRVTEYTGVSFYGSTSVGMSQVLEFYVNFGTIGVFVGFAILGCILTLIDEGAARYLWHGNWRQFALWYFPALALLRPDNDLFVLTTSWVSGTVMIILIDRAVDAVLRTEAGRRGEEGPSLPSAQVPHAQSTKLDDAGRGRSR